MDVTMTINNESVTRDIEARSVRVLEYRGAGRSGPWGQRAERAIESASS